MSLGRLGEAVPFHERKNAMVLSREDWRSASIGYRNLAELHAYLGALAASAEAARQALALARRAEDKFGECQSLAYQALVAHLRGDLEMARAIFQQAETVERERHSSDMRYLYSNRGIFHADHLRRAGDPGYARRVTEANLEGWVRDYKWPKDESQCHRVLGDLDADANQHDSARTHYDQALKIARGITRRDALIEALLARGRWAARCAYQTSEVSQTSEVLAAFSDLNEALGYAVDGGYRIYEADIRVALAWAHLAAGDRQAARAEAERAQRMGADMGYHWGQVDAAEVLAALDQR
jgi:tetratricopeptide (TPR) repeat protein